LQEDGFTVSWSQNTDEVFIKLPVSDDVRGKDVAFEVHPTRLSLKINGQTALAGSLIDAGAVSLDGAYHVGQWLLE
jgi:hypothetical protein